MPLLTTATLGELVEAHAATGNAVTVLTAVGRPHGLRPGGTGRRRPVARIVEQKDADAEQRTIREINSGMYAFDAAVLRDGSRRSTPTTRRARSTSPT